ncbi:transporter, partial [Pseudomonas sp. HMWF031]
MSIRAWGCVASLFAPVLGAGILFPAMAQASGIPYASNRPQSFQFSSDFTEPYNSVGQEFEYNNDRKRFDDHG